MLRKLFKFDNEKTSINVNGDRKGQFWKGIGRTSLLATLMMTGTWSFAGGVLPSTAQTIITPSVGCVSRTATVKKGDWRTLVSLWNADATTFFRDPAGAEIKVRYGLGIFGFDAQKQKLDGRNEKRLSVGGGSVAYARMQIRVPFDTTVAYVYCPSGSVP